MAIGPIAGALFNERSHIPLVNVPKKKKAKKPIRKVSKKRGPLNAQYMRLRADFLKTHPYCQWFLTEIGNRQENVRADGMAIDNNENRFVMCPLSTEIHHRKGRGKYLLDTLTWMAVSNEGHKAIHADPKTSYAKGYMLPRR